MIGLQEIAEADVSSPSAISASVRLVISKVVIVGLLIGKEER
jgi:hypothetical protein